MVETEMYASKYISDFISFLNDVRQTHSMAQASLEEANEELCDLEHYLEFESCSGATMAKISKRIREVRKKRRKAKNAIEICEQILNWSAENKRAVDTLSNLLGQIRKTENRQDTRAYSVRTHILDDISQKSHLSAHSDQSGANGIG